MPKYHRIIYLEDYKDEQLNTLMKQRDVDAIAEYLSQWDYGEYHDTPREEPWGRDSTTYSVSVKGSGDYIVALNYALGSASLYTLTQDTDENDSE